MKKIIDFLLGRNPAKHVTIAPKFIASPEEDTYVFFHKEMRVREVSSSRSSLIAERDTEDTVFSGNMNPLNLNANIFDLSKNSFSDKFLVMGYFRKSTGTPEGKYVVDNTTILCTRINYIGNSYSMERLDKNGLIRCGDFIRSDDENDPLFRNIETIGHMYGYIYFSVDDVRRDPVLKDMIRIGCEMVVTITPIST